MSVVLPTEPPHAVRAAAPVLAALCDTLAAVLTYPDEETAAQARAAAARLCAGNDSAAALAVALMDLATHLDHAPTGEAEERYTLLFDLKPVSTLHCGYHLLGDTYERGALLASLAAELKGLGVAYAHDLPDYLPTLLRLLGRLPAGEEQALLTYPVLLPGLAKINAALATSQSLYAPLLAHLAAWLGDVVPRCGVDFELRASGPVEALPGVAAAPPRGGRSCAM